MRAQEFTTEAFNQPYKLKWEKGDHGDIDAYAKLDDGNYLSIMFNKGYSQGTKEEAWSVEFFRNNSQEVTGEGDAYRIFATVLTAMQQFIKKYKPNRIIFSASKELDPTIYYGPDDIIPNPASRAKLYDTMVQRYARAWGFRAFRADTGDKVIYELNKIKPVAEGFLDRFKKQLTAHRGGIDLTASKQDGRIIIVATSHGKELGNVIFNVNGENLVAAGLGVLPEYQGQGIAEIMYNWAKELGYTVQRSSNQTDAGKRFWDKNKGEETTVWEQDVAENFADGKNPGRKGLAKRSGVNCKQSVTKLRDIAAHSTGERQRMAHWCANMKSGKKK